MVQTFPAVRRATNGWTVTLALTAFITSSAGAGAVLGLILGVAGQLIPLPFRGGLLVGTALIAVAIELGLPLPRPQRRRQVPSAWRDRLPPPVFVSLYGALLGAGVFTFVPHATLYVVLAGAALAGPLPGAFIMLVYGGARSLPVLWTIHWQIDDAAYGGLALTRWDRSVRRVNAAAVVAATVVFGWSGLLGWLPGSR